MENKMGKYIWTTKVSNKGQIVIPKEARDVFGIAEGDTLILFGDKERGIAIAKYADYLQFAEEIFRAGQAGGQANGRENGQDKAQEKNKQKGEDK